MEIQKQLTKEQILAWLAKEEEEFSIENFRKKYKILPDSDVLYVTFNRLIQERKLRRLRRGWYRKVPPVEPINWWDGEKRRNYPIVWPYGVDDNSSFHFDDSIEILPGDIIALAGRSNAGKSCFAINFLVNNLHLFKSALLMVNEFKPDRFRNRMERIDWVDFWNESKPRFKLLPVDRDHANFIEPDGLNVIDWLHVTDNFWQVANQIQDMQMQLRQGILLVVLQKTAGKNLGVGGDWGTFFPAVYMTIDYPYRLTVWKVKGTPEPTPGQPVATKPEGKMYAFDIIDRGSKFHRIREVRSCRACKGTGSAFGADCKACEGKGYLDA
jgi:hypothetical protein